VLPWEMAGRGQGELQRDGEKNSNTFDEHLIVGLGRDARECGQDETRVASRRLGRSFRNKESLIWRGLRIVGYRGSDAAEE